MQIKSKKTGLVQEVDPAHWLEMQARGDARRFEVVAQPKAPTRGQPAELRTRKTAKAKTKTAQEREKKGDTQGALEAFKEANALHSTRDTRRAISRLEKSAVDENEKNKP